MGKLSDTRLRGLKPRDKRYMLSDGEGLYLEVMTSGRKVWLLRMMYNKQTHKAVLGEYPLISISEARELRDKKKKEIISGGVSSGEVVTFQQVADVYFDRQEAKSRARGRSKFNERGRAIKYLYPAIGERDITTITPPVLRDLLLDIGIDGSNETAYRCKLVLKKVFDAYNWMYPDKPALYPLSRIEKVVESIDHELLAPQQSVVDGYAASLQEAINGLVVVEAASLDYINNALLTATACSEQSTSGSEGPAANVLDGNTSTIWHTKWAGDECADSGANSHWIQLSTKDGEPITIAGFEYTPRTSGTNGLITGYDIQVKKTADGGWESVATGTWANNNQVKTVEFDAVDAVAVRLVATESQHDGNITFGSAAEIRLVNGNTAAYVKAIEAAKALLEGTPDSESVEQAKIAINKAYAALRFVETEVPEPEPGEDVDTSKLEAAIEAAEALTESDYTAESWAAVEEALADAKAALESTDQKVVDAAAEALNAAVAALEKAEEPGPGPEPETPSYDALHAAIEAAEALKADDYTTESWAKVEAALADAKAALGSDSQDEVDAAAAALNAAMDALVESDPGTDPGTDPDQPGTDEPGTDPDKPGTDEPGDTTDPDDQKPGDTTKPGGSTSGGGLAQTGDPTSAVAALAAALAGAGALVASRKRR